jgi:hypothetical protein
LRKTLREELTNEAELADCLERGMTVEEILSNLANNMEKDRIAWR